MKVTKSLSLDLISKKLYIDRLDDKINKCNNTYHSEIKKKPVDLKSSTYIDSSRKINNTKFKMGGIVKISKYRNMLV